jgi:hypothetical protein
MTGSHKLSTGHPVTGVEDSSALLAAIMGALPVDASVQDDEARLLVLNEHAAAAIGDKIPCLRCTISFGVRPTPLARIGASGAPLFL